MKTYNEQTRLRVASLIRQRDQLTAQINTLQAYLTTTQSRPAAPASKTPSRPKTKPATPARQRPSK